MSQATERPIEFLQAAKAAAEQYANTKAALEQQQTQKRRLEKELERLKKDMAEQMESTVSRRKNELEASYNQQLSQIENRIKKTETAREKAKNQGVKERIEMETEDLVLDNKALKHQLGALFKEKQVPAFCKTNLYYILFNPSGLKEWLLFLLSFVFVFAALPVGIYFLLPDRVSWYLIPIYVAVIIVFGGLYLKVNNATRVKHAEAIKQGRILKNNARANHRKIRAMTHAIRSDANEDGYNLKEFDDELAKARQELAELSRKKQEAQNAFETVTRNIIVDEIENARKKDIEALSVQLSTAGEQLAQLTVQEQKQALSLSSEYEAFVGKRNMDAARLGKMLAMLESGEAASVQEAAEKL